MTNLFFGLEKDQPGNSGCQFATIIAIGALRVLPIYIHIAVS